jgi:hypothetical protein
MSRSKHAKAFLLEKAEAHLRQLSPGSLRVATDFLAYLQETEEDEATQELLALAGFDVLLQQALKQAESGEIVRFRDIRR